LRSENFPHTPLIFKYLACRKRLYWVNDKEIVSSKNKKIIGLQKYFQYLLRTGPMQYMHFQIVMTINLEEK